MSALIALVLAGKGLNAFSVLFRLKKGMATIDLGYSTMDS
jgi:hypothetical protein